MSVDFSKITELSDSYGNITQITDASGRVIWAAGGGKIVLEVARYDIGSTDSADVYIRLDVYPKTNGTVEVTYGGLTKTITDTSGVANPNAQSVTFGKVDGVDDGTPNSGTLTITGECQAFALGTYTRKVSGSNVTYRVYCVTKIADMGNVHKIPDKAFEGNAINVELTSVNISRTVKTIGSRAFYGCYFTDITIPESVTLIGDYAFDNGRQLVSVKVLATTPPDIGTSVFSTSLVLNTITVPKGCGAAYKAADGWSTYAYLIVEAL